MRLLRATRPHRPVVAPLGDAVLAMRKRDYAEGLRDGVILFAKLALGQPAATADPYSGPALPEEFRVWARDALCRAEELGGSVE